MLLSKAIVSHVPHENKVLKPLHPPQYILSLSTDGKRTAIEYCNANQ